LSKERESETRSIQKSRPEKRIDDAEGPGDFKVPEQRPKKAKIRKESKVFGTKSGGINLLRLGVGVSQEATSAPTKNAKDVRHHPFRCCRADTYNKVCKLRKKETRARFSMKEGPALQCKWVGGLRGGGKKHHPP